MKIKTSDILNDMMDNLVEQLEPDELADFLFYHADYHCYDSNLSYEEGVEDGVGMVSKALLKMKPIYQVCSTKIDLSVYFIGELSKIKALINKTLKERCQSQSEQRNSI